PDVPRSLARPHRVASDVPFYTAMIVIGGAYVLLIVGMLLADAAYMVLGDSAAQLDTAWAQAHPWLARLLDNPIGAALSKPEIQYSIVLSLISCTFSAILSVWVAVPIGYLLSRHRFWGR